MLLLLTGDLFLMHFNLCLVVCVELYSGSIHTVVVTNSCYLLNDIKNLNFCVDDNLLFWLQSAVIFSVKIHIFFWMLLAIWVLSSKVFEKGKKYTQEKFHHHQYHQYHHLLLCFFFISIRKPYIDAVTFWKTLEL